MGEWKKLSADDLQHIFDECNIWNLGCKNNRENGIQAQTNKTNIKRQIKKIQDRLDASKTRIGSFPNTAAESENISVNPSDSIQGINISGKSAKVNYSIGEVE